MQDDVLEESQVRGHAADAKLAQGAVHAPDCLFRIVALGRDLDQQRIVEGRDHRARVGGAGIEADAGAGGAAVGSKLAVVGREVLFRILGRDPALQCVPVQHDVPLRRNVGIRFADARPFSDADLRLDDVDAGDFLRDRVLDLDARIDLDEVELAGIGIHEELDGAGMRVIDAARQLQRRLAERLALLWCQVRRGRPLDHLLIAPLHRAVALEQMHQIAVLVAENLHFDVAGADDHLLQIDLVVAESCRRFPAGDFDGRRQLSLAVDGAHAAAAATPTGFQHQRIADLGRLFATFVDVVRQGAGGRYHGYTDPLGERAGGNLVAQFAHDFRTRSDEQDAGFAAGFGKVRVFGQEAVARMDGIHLRQLGDADDVVDIEIGLDGLLAGADQIALVGLGAVQGQAIFVGVDADGTDAQFAGGAHDANGDLGAVGDQDAADVLEAHSYGPALNWRRPRFCPKCGLTGTN